MVGRRRGHVQHSDYTTLIYLFEKEIQVNRQLKYDTRQDLFSKTTFRTTCAVGSPRSADRPHTDSRQHFTVYRWPLRI